MDMYVNILWYLLPQADTFLLCYSLVCPDSLRLSTDFWYPYIKRFNQNSPVVLVGCQVKYEE